MLALRDQQMSEDQQRDEHTSVHLDAVAWRRLDELMDIYRRGMVQKAQALKVAVDRGLQPPLG